jgi:flagellum-specific peptidoglycan hydrolase FlgJ
MYSDYTYQNMKRFIGLYGRDIAEAIRGTGLFFSAVAAQKAMESDYGQSELAKKYNNFGGIKNFGSLQGAGKVLLDTTEVVKGKKVSKKQPFATYSNPRVAFQSYVAVLKDPTKKYAQMGVFAAKTPEEQIKKMVQAGYSTMSPQAYLNLVQSRIDAARDISKLGKIK